MGWAHLCSDLPFANARGTGAGCVPSRALHLRSGRNLPDGAHRKKVPDIPYRCRLYMPVGFCHGPRCFLRRYMKRSPERTWDFRTSTRQKAGAFLALRKKRSRPIRESV